MIEDGERAVNNILSKSKSKEIEHLRSELRKLRKSLSRSEKRKHLYESSVDDQSEEFVKEEIEDRRKTRKNLCPNCDNELELIDLGIKKLIICNCGYRKVQK